MLGKEGMFNILLYVHNKRNETTRKDIGSHSNTNIYQFFLITKLRGFLKSLIGAAIIFVLIQKSKDEVYTAYSTQCKESPIPLYDVNHGL